MYNSKVDSLFKDVLLESIISEYRNASAQMNVSERQLFDDSLVQSIAERGTEIMHCATMLFLGMVDDATTFAESHGGGGGGSRPQMGTRRGRGQSSMGTPLYEDGEPHDALDYRQEI